MRGPYVAELPLVVGEFLCKRDELQFTVRVRIEIANLALDHGETGADFLPATACGGCGHALTAG